MGALKEIAKGDPFSGFTVYVSFLLFIYTSQNNIFNAHNSHHCTNKPSLLVTDPFLFSMFTQKNGSILQNAICTGVPANILSDTVVNISSPTFPDQNHTWPKCMIIKLTQPLTLLSQNLGSSQHALRISKLLSHTITTTTT